MSVRILRPRALAASLFRPSAQTTFTPFPHASRPFSLESTPEVLSAHRTLPYPTLPIYDIITSIDSYPDFIPFCTSAHISAYSNPDPHFQRRWPQRASLTIGYGTQINETFVSRVFCVPPIPEKGRAGVGYVEAVSGAAQSSLDPAMMGHHSDRAGEGPTVAGPMEYLRTRWTVKNYPYKPGPEDGAPAQEGNVQPRPEARQMTDVSLTLEYKFSNMFYDAMGKAVAGTIADKMIEAFVKRVEHVMKSSPAPSSQAKRFEA